MQKRPEVGIFPVEGGRKGKFAVIHSFKWAPNYYKIVGSKIAQKKVLVRRNMLNLALLSFLHFSFF